MSDEVPITKQEVHDLVTTVPPEHVTQALIDTVKHDIGADDPFRIKFLKWLSLASFMIVVVIALATLVDSRNKANERAERNAERSECRAAIAGNVSIATASGTLAGNLYNATLGEMLVLAVNRQTADNPRFVELTRTLADTSTRLREAQELITIAIARQEDVLDICADGVP